MKSNEEIAEEVKEIIARVTGKAVEAIKESQMLDEVSNDSIQLFELLLAFEKQYAVEATYEDVAKLNSVDDIISYVRKVKYS